MRSSDLNGGVLWFHVGVWSAALRDSTFCLLDPGAPSHTQVPSTWTACRLAECDLRFGHPMSLAGNTLLRHFAIVVGEGSPVEGQVGRGLMQMRDPVPGWTSSLPSRIPVPKDLRCSLSFSPVCLWRVCGNDSVNCCGALQCPGGRHGEAQQSGDMFGWTWQGLIGVSTSLVLPTCFWFKIAPQLAV